MPVECPFTLSIDDCKRVAAQPKVDPSTDEQLRQRVTASLSGTVLMMRLVYILLAHQLPGQLIRLVDRLEGPDVQLLIHLDLNMPDDEVRTVHRELAARPHVEFLRRHRCTWGAFSIVESTLEGLRRCESLTFDYAVLLNGQDYPIKSRDEIDSYLEQLAGKSIIDNNPFPMAEWNTGGWNRIQDYQAHDRRRWLRGVARVLNALPLRRPYPRGIHPYGGAQFWALSSPAVHYVLDFIARNPKFVAAYRFTFAADEMFFQTIVGNAGESVPRVGDAVNFLEWDRPGLTLTSDDFPTLAQTYHLYARKFDMRVDAAVLDMIDKELL